VLSLSGTLPTVSIYLTAQDKKMSLSKIHNCCVNDITWNDAATCNCQIGDQIDIYRIGIGANLPHLNNLSTLLNTGETARAKRYFQLNDRNRFIISRGALRIILGKYLNQQAAAIEFEIGPNKKPFIKNTNGVPVCYNVSHSGDWIVIAVAAAEIGVDTELINHTFEFKDIIAEYFNPGEINYINSEQSCERLFKLWTRKEALIKATAKGLDDGLKFIPGLDGDHTVQADMIGAANDWTVSSFELYKNYVASVAGSGQANELMFWDITFKQLQ
jgi:4'-phosphopantetheinyl transferase